MCTGLSLQVTLGVIQVHRPLITGCPSRLGNQSSCKVYPLFRASAKFTDLSLQITPYKEDRKNNI